VLAGASSAFACGNGGYTYAGVAAPTRAYGIRAAITPLSPFNILDGHVAGWVGVGGPNQGPGGSDEWLQVGFSGFPAPAGNNLYYELMLPSGNPVYHQIAAGLPAGKAANVAVLEMSGRPDVWRVWVNGSPVSKPLRLPGSHGRFAPIATAESWDGGSGGTCNGFLYRFRGVSVASSPGGGWQPLAGGTTIKSASTRLAANARFASFLAAEGDDAVRTLATLSP
jgi:hypothetical protein